MLVCVSIPGLSVLVQTWSLPIPPTAAEGDVITGSTGAGQRNSSATLTEQGHSAAERAVCTGLYSPGLHRGDKSEIHRDHDCHYCHPVNADCRCGGKQAALAALPDKQPGGL